MSLQRKHKTFRFFQLMPIDANNVLFEQALLRLLVLLHTNGRLITRTDPVKPEFPEQIIDIIKEDTEHFEGISGTQRERMIKNWFASDFATIVKEGKERSGKGRIANLKPLHMSTIKLLNTKIRSQDRDASLFLYNVFKGSEIIRNDGFLIPFLTEGTQLHGTYNLKLNEEDISLLDVETLFLLRILENFKVDNPDTQSKIPPFEFICSAQRELFLTDILTLLAYKNSIPRRELFQYFSILTMFHTALYTIKTFSLVNGFFEKKSTRCNVCKSITSSKDFNSLIKCQYHSKIFVDMTNGQDRTCDRIASNNVNEHYAEMYRYFKSHYKLKKLNDYSKTTTTSDLSLDDLLKFLDNPVTDAYFALHLNEILDYEDNRNDPDIKTIIDSGMSPFEKYIEILCQDKSNWKALVSRHKKLMSSLCGMNREDWRYIFSLRKTINSTLSVVGVVWLIIESTSFFSQPLSEFFKVYWLYSFIIAALWVIYENRPKTEFNFKLKNRDISIQISIGDMFTYKGSYIIPFNTSLDTTFKDGLISKNSTQGQFTVKYFKEPRHLDGDINTFLAERQPSETLPNKQKGNQFKYDIGLIIKLKLENDKYAYLSAISDMNDEGVASTSFDNILISLGELWDFILTKGELGVLNIPILGTGRGRIIETRETIIKAIVNSFIASTSSGKRFCDKLNIVINPKDFKEHKIDLKEICDFLRLKCEHYEHDTNTSGIGQAID